MVKIRRVGGVVSFSPPLYLNNHPISSISSSSVSSSSYLERPFENGHGRHRAKPLCPEQQRLVEGTEHRVAGRQHMGVEEEHHQFTCALVLLCVAHAEGVGGEVGGGLAYGAQEHDEGEVEVLDAVGVLTELCVHKLCSQLVPARCYTYMKVSGFV